MEQRPQGPFEGQSPQQWQGQYPPQGQPFPPPYQQFGQQPPPFVPPPASAPKKKSRRGLLIGSIVVGVALLICIIASATSHSGGSSSANATTNTSANTTTQTQPTAKPQPTTKPTQVPKWTTVQSFSGNGSKNTPTFSVGNNWKIVWTCDPNSFDGQSFNVIITPTGTDGVPTDTGVNTTCSATNTHDETSVQSGGTIALDIISEGSWTIKVEELK